MYEHLKDLYDMQDWDEKSAEHCDVLERNLEIFDAFLGRVERKDVIRWKNKNTCREESDVVSAYNEGKMLAIPHIDPVFLDQALGQFCARCVNTTCSDYGVQCQVSNFVSYLKGEK